MTSEEMRALIPQYLGGRLTPEERVLFEAQLDANSELRQEKEELQLLWEDLGALSDEQPSAALRARFYRKLDEMNSGQRRPSTAGFAWWKPGLAGLVRQAVVAVALFACGVYVGHERLGRGATTTGSTDEVKRLGTEVQSLRQTVALSLLERQSATSRLEGISWGNRVEHPDSDLVGALVTVLEHDPNINVRLSALDALGKFTDEAGVRQAMVQAIPLQDSPLVQIALIDALVHMRDHGAAKELRKLSGNTEINAAVRQRAQWGLQKLNYQ